MRRLLKLEFTKLWSARYFRVLIVLWLLAFIAIPIGFKIFLYWLENETTEQIDALGLTITQLPIFHFSEIWHNLSYAYKMLNIFMGFILIISVTNEMEYRTMRQNVIDGLSRREWLYSKWYLVLALATGATVLVFILGLVAGFVWNNDVSLSDIFYNIGFLGAYWIDVVLFLMIAATLSLLLRRAGLSIALLIFWMYILEPIVIGILRYNEYFFISNLFPVEASHRVVPWVIPHIIMIPGDDYIPYDALLIAFVWLVLAMTAMWRMVTRRDL